jgi:aminopeptidase N
MAPSDNDFSFALHPVAQPAQHSFAEPDQVVVTHIDLNLAMDFTHRRLAGDATLTLDWKSPDATRLVLDTEALDISRIEAVNGDGNTEPLDYTLTEPEHELGSQLTISTPEHPGEVRIAYATAPTASGLQWLEPAQTAGDKHPFMFSQSEATHARSWIPLQDSPAIRLTWSAHIKAPEGVRVIMSAVNDARHPADGDFRFEQTHPVPSYLLAIAAGDLTAHETGPRSAVFAEPSIVEAAAAEFEDTEEMIRTTEALYGPYPWDRYDILVLPPSFPFGGMENPEVTFATPTVLVGDKSLVSLVAHELAHSWSGNLITAAAWRDIWLNEGVTTYVQNRITEAVFGARQANEETLLDIQALRVSLESMRENRQRLAPEPDETPADDMLSDVPYKKGSWFLRTLERRFGRQHFDTWLKSYFAHFAWHSITTEQMLEHLKTHLIEAHPDTMNWEEVEQWIYGAGIPADARAPASKPFDAIDAGRDAFLKGNLAAAELEAEHWNTQEWMYFLDGLPDKTPLALIEALDTHWHLTATPNAEIGMRWYRRAIGAGNTAVHLAAAEHVSRIGRMYLVKPVYKAFAGTPEGLAYAREVYNAARSGYHPLTCRAVERVFAEAEKP